MGAEGGAAHQVVGAQLHRPRVVSVLSARFERRLVELRASAGFGKTTAIAQAAAEAPLLGHLDVVVACRDIGGRAALLRQRVLEQLDRPAVTSDEDFVDAVFEAVLARAPSQVCVVVDDAHLLDDVGSLVSLIDRLPGNGHLLIATRRDLDLPTSRLMASGEHLVVDDGVLAFDAAESAEFASLTGSDPARIERSGGWPAHASLVARAGEHLATRFVVEQVLETFGRETVEDLSRWSCIGRADEEVLGVVLDTADVRALIDRTPLVEASEAGWKLHDLWRTALDGTLSDIERRAAQVRAARALVDADPARACDLWIAAEAWSELDAYFRDCAIGFADVPPAAAIGSLLASLPDHVASTPAATMIGALARQSLGDPEALDLLFIAANRCREIDDSVGETSALLNACILADDHRNGEAFAIAETRLLELAAAGDDRAVDVSQLVQAVHARAEQRSEDGLAILDRLEASGSVPAVAWALPWIRSSLLLQRGDPELAIDLSSRGMEGPSDAIATLAMATLGWSHWLRGEPEITVSFADAGFELAIRNPNRDWRYTALVYFSYALLMTGRRDRGERLLADAHEFRALDVGARSMCGVVDAVVAVLDLDDERATEALAGVFDDAVITDTLRRTAALWWVLIPESRPRLAGLTGCYEHARHAAEALLAVRRGDDDALRMLPVPSPELLSVHLPPPWTAELARGLARAGRTDDAVRIIEETNSAVQRAFDTLVVASDAPPTEFTSRLTPRPRHSWELSVLGELVLTEDGVVCDAPHWRRRRVQELLCFLVEHPDARRDAVMAAMWPDKGEVSARRNLEVTLSYLGQLLDGERASGERPYFLRTDDRTIRLHRGSALQVDVDRWDELLGSARGHERAGVPSAALGDYLTALEHFGGSPYPIRATGEWLDEVQRRRTIEFVSAATRAADLLNATDEPGHAAAIARRAIDMDRWSLAAHDALVAATSRLGDPTALDVVVRERAGIAAELGLDPED